MPIPWSCEPHTDKSDYYGGPDSPGFTIWPDCAIVSGLSVSSGRLINAASDLLSACQAVASDCERVLDGDDFSGMTDAELFGAFLDVLLPAIEKATGGIAWDASTDGPMSE